MSCALRPTDGRFARAPGADAVASNPPRARDPTPDGPPGQVTAPLPVVSTD